MNKLYFNRGKLCKSYANLNGNKWFCNENRKIKTKDAIFSEIEFNYYENNQNDRELIDTKTETEIQTEEYKCSDLKRDLDKVNERMKNDTLEELLYKKKRR